jgi:DNA-binding CsgD family transcriptional regulator
MQQYSTMDEVRYNYDTSLFAEELKLSYNEYMILYRIKEGCSSKEILTLSAISTATLSRRKRSIAKKLKVNTFEVSIIKLTQAGFFDES